MSSLSILGVSLRARVYLRTREMNISVVMAPRHSGETVIGEFAGNIVLIDPLEQAIQFLIAGLQGFQLLLLQFSVGGLRLLGMADHSLHKLILKLAGKLSQPPDLA